MRLLFVNTLDVAGGAENVCLALARECLDLGHTVQLAVGKKSSDLAFVQEISAARSYGDRVSDVIGQYSGRIRGAQRLQRLVDSSRSPGRALRKALGIEEFDFPASRLLLADAPEKWDLLHAHNLHGGYFDLRALSQTSHRMPVVVTLHDAWLLTGHCAHSLGCERWLDGCGNCPDLSIYPPIERDATRMNWHRKKQIFEHARLHVATPSRWLRDRVEESMLYPGVRSLRVIPNGVDLEMFHPADGARARAALSIPPDTDVVMVAANGLSWNRFKDYATLLGALDILASRHERSLICLAVGESAPDIVKGKVTIRHIPFVTDKRKMASLFNAAHVYVHPALEDTYPTSVLEAMACGIPVVASNVGGIPEQVQDGTTGWLSRPRDAEDLAIRIGALLGDNEMRARFGEAAGAVAAQHFSQAESARIYLDWYAEILNEERSAA